MRAWGLRREGPDVPRAVRHSPFPSAARGGDGVPAVWLLSSLTHFSTAARFGRSPSVTITPDNFSADLSVLVLFPVLPRVF